MGEIRKPGFLRTWLFPAPGDQTSAASSIRYSIGAGLPAGALITTDQKSATDDPLADGLILSRGIIEIKAPDADATPRATR